MAKKRKRKQGTWPYQAPPKPLKARVIDALLSPFKLAKKKDESAPIRYAADMKEEIAVAANTYNSYFGDESFRSTDQIIRNKGRGLFEFYDSMADSDAVLAGIIETRIDSVARLDWDILPASDDERDVEVADIVQQALLGLDNFDEDLSELLAACRNGYAVSEIVWKEESINGKSRWVPDRILSRPPDWFRFTADRELVYVGQSRFGNKNNEPVPDYKFIHYAFRPRYQNPYGTSLLRAVYWVYWFKHHAFEQWMRAAERGANSTVIGHYPSGTNVTEQEAIEEKLKIMLKSKYGLFEDGTLIDIPDVKIDANFGDVLVSRCNQEMLYRLLGTTLSSGTSESGTRALGEVHEKRLQERNQSDSIALSSTLNKTLIRWIVELNFPDAIAMPTFKQHYEAQKDDTLNINKLRAAAELGIPVSVNDAANLLDLPIAQEGEDLISISAGGMGQPVSSPTIPDESEEDLEPEEGGDIVEKKRKPGAVIALKRRESNFQFTKEKLSVGAYDYGLPTYHGLAEQLDLWLLKHKDLEDALLDVNEFIPNIKPFKGIMHDSILWSLLNGVDIVFELPKFKRKNSTDAEWNPRTEALAQWKPMKAQEAIAHFTRKGILTRDEFDKLDAWSRRQALTAARLTEEVIETRLKPALERAIEEGMTIKQFQRQVRDVVISDAHAENIFRTNVATSFSQGNLEASRSAHGKAAIPAMEFVAVLDDRTTPQCDERNGNIYPADGVESLDIVPPLHFMCRSDLIPVFEDEWDGAVADDPSVRAQEGFGRWKSILGE